MKPQLSVPVRWPPGPVPLVITLVFVPLVAVAFLPPAARGLPVLSHVSRFSLLVFGTQRVVQGVMGAAVAVHVLEALHTLSICGAAGLPAGQRVGWAALVFLLGVGALLPLKQLLRKAAAAGGKRR